MKLFVKIGAIFIVCIIFVLLITLCVCPLKYGDIIAKMSEKYGVSKQTIHSVINTESHYNKNGISSAGAVGLMQIMPSTAIWISQELKMENFEVEMLLEPEINIEFGTFYLSYLLKKFEEENTAIASYNAGETIVRQWLNNEEFSQDARTLNNIPYKETNDYVRKFSFYKKIYSFYYCIF